MTTQRDAYADVGRATRESWAAAVAAGCTSAELALLGAVHTWTSTWSRMSDHVSLPQLARVAGLWSGEGECPRDVRRRVSTRLARLADVGAIEYTPGGRAGQGSMSIIGLPQPDGCDGWSALTGRTTAPEELATEELGGPISHPPTPETWRAPGRPSNGSLGGPHVPLGGLFRPLGGPLRGPHPRRIPRSIPRRGARSTRKQQRKASTSTASRPSSNAS